MRRAAAVLIAIGASTAIAAPALTAPATEPVDVTSEGAAPGGPSGRPVISGDGRWVVFSSEAALTPDDTNASVDVYVRDLAEDRTVLVSAAPDGVYRLNYDPAISDDGRFVAFTSQGRGLLPQDSNDEEDVYLKDLSTGALIVASARPGGRATGGRYSALSGNGRWVAFVGDELVRGDRNGDWDVYVRSVTTGAVRLVSRDNRGRQTRAAFDDVDLSSDGSRVAYVAGGAVYVYDRSSGRRVRADVNNRGGPAQHSWPFGNVSLSGNGRVLAFASTAANLPGANEERHPNVYVRDLRQRRTELVSADADGRAPEGATDSWSVSISGTGRFVAFGSEAELAGAAPDDGEFDVFLRDRQERRTSVVTDECSGGAGHPSLSNDALWVAFESEACEVSPQHGTLFARGSLDRP